MFSLQSLNTLPNPDAQNQQTQHPQLNLKQH